MIEELPYVHELVELEGVGTIHCWASLYVAPNGNVYTGNVQLDYPGPMFGKPDFATGKRTVLRRAMVPEDENVLREALMAKVKKTLEAK